MTSSDLSQRARLEKCARAALRRLHPEWHLQFADGSLQNEVNIIVDAIEAGLQEALQPLHLCVEHQPDRWESDGTCPICEGHRLQEALQEKDAEIARLRAVLVSVYGS